MEIREGSEIVDMLKSISARILHQAFHLFFLIKLVPFLELDLDGVQFCLSTH